MPMNMRKRIERGLYLVLNRYCLASCLHFVYHSCKAETLVYCRILALYKSKRDEEEKARGRIRNQLQEDKV